MDRLHPFIEKSVLRFFYQNISLKQTELKFFRQKHKIEKRKKINIDHCILLFICTCVYVTKHFEKKNIKQKIQIRFL